MIYKKFLEKMTEEIFKLDLTEIKGEGEIPCPTCGAIISPDDGSEENYKIIEVKLKGDLLEEVEILCNKCKTKIILVGFERLKKS